MAIEPHIYPYFVPQLHNEMQMNQNKLVDFDPNSFLPDSNANGYNTTNQQSVSPTFQKLAVEFDLQKEEELDLDGFIRTQNEKLRIMMQEHRRQQVAILLKKVESDMLHMLRQKNEQIAQATKKWVDLEEFLTRLEADNQSWRRAAQENEALVLSLYNALEQIQERASYGFNGGVATADVESCCDQNMIKEEGTGGGNRVTYEGVGGVDKITRQSLVCECCHSQIASFMFLPCRHLCSCKACETILQECPVCKIPKKSSIETMIF